MTCIHGHPMPSDARYCSICGARPTTEPIAPLQSNGQGLATGALVLGILGFLTAPLLLGLPLSVAAIVLGAVVLGTRRPGRGMGIAGLVLGVLGTIGALLIIAALITIVALGIDPNTLLEQTRTLATTLP